MAGKRLNEIGGTREIPRNYIRAWRLYRNRMTLEELAAKAGLSVATISDAETRKGDVTGKTLLEIAHALDTTPGALMDVDPKIGEPWWEMWESLSPRQRRQAESIIKALRESDS